MSCGSLNNSLLAELDIQKLVEDNCEMTTVCGERIILVLADLVMCLTGACVEDQFPDWARPATCAAIAITALVFFSLMYFGKSCTESRVKVRYFFHEIGIPRNPPGTHPLIIIVLTVTFLHITGV